MKAKLLILLLLAGNVLYSQTKLITGKITNTNNEAVPFATVYLKNTSIGTSANVDGEYSLKITTGQKEVIFKAVGYRQIIKTINITDNTNLNVELQSELFELKSVEVRANGKDPAYAIMKKAINKRKSYLKEVNAYTADVYIKGLQRLTKAPKKFMGRDIDKFAKQMGLDSNRTGIIYLSESNTKLSYEAPANYREEMLSSKVSGNNRAFSFNRATDMNINFYENLQELDGLSNRPFISPIAENAFFYYDYKLIGSSFENGEEINKIELIPKRKYDPVFRGYIYIVENSWRIHSLNVLMTKEANINVLDSLGISQQYLPVDKNRWMPASVKYEFTGGFLGFKFGGYFVALYSNYNLNPQFAKNEFKEVLKITSEVNKKDSLYWSQTRPIPLTAEEVTDYTKKDSLAKRKQQKPYIDSLDKENNKFKIKSFLFLGGYSVRNTAKKETFRIGSLLGSTLYNTVEGFAINYDASYTKQIDTINNRYLGLRGKLRYGFSNKLFNADVSANIPVLKRYTLGLALGSDVLDLNNLGTLLPLNNSINSLFYERNYMKLYQKKFASAIFYGRIVGGLRGSISTEWANRKWLPNTSTYKILDDKEIEFSSNNPFVPLVDIPLFPDNQSFKIDVGLSYQFSNKYISYLAGKYYVPSKYPTLAVNYTKGIRNFLGSDADYDLVYANLFKNNVKLGFYGSFSFNIGAGKFLNNNNVFYTDLKHFKGNKTRVVNQNYNSFMFLDYYTNSTAKSYLEGHIEHNFCSFFTNKIPLIRKLKLKEVAGANYLHTPDFKNYAELFFGLQYLNIKAYYGYSFADGSQTHSGFRFAVGL